MINNNLNHRRKYALFALVLCGFSSCASHNYSHRVSNHKFRLVIDAGHGGHDAGAIGRHGLSEKQLTLDIARRIRKLMAQVMPQVKVILTRKSDVYVSLEDRVKIANQAKGDLFVSLHINSSDNKEASGFEVYSLDIASDRHAERLAARENKSFKAKKNVNFILADLRANDHRDSSDQLAGLISQGLSKQLSKKIANKYINDRGYNQAIFHVLFVNMPSVLTELFFISNPQEESMLKQSAVRELCARGIVTGIKKFLDNRVLRAHNVDH